MITILTIDLTLGGGIERVITNKSNYLISKGYSIRIISFFQTNSKLKYNLNKNVNIKYLSNKKFNNRYKYHLIRLFPKLLKELKSSQIIVSMYPIISILLSTTKFRNKVIASEHSEYYSQGKILRILRRISYKYLSKIITLTEDGTLNFAKIGIKAHRIPNSTNFKPVEKGILKSPIKILFIGRLEEVKNPLLFIQIGKWFEQYSRLNINFEMYGDGPMRRSIELSIKNHKNITLMPFSSKIERILEKSHALILTSHTEAFPMVAIEAITKQVLVYGMSTQIGTVEIIGKESPRISTSKEISKLCFQIEKDFSSKESYSKALLEIKKNQFTYQEKNIMKTWEDLFKTIQ